MLAGERILLRGIEEEDLKALLKWNFDPETTRFMSARLPGNMKEQRDWFAKQQGGDKKKLIIECAKTAEQIGMIGIMQIDHLNKNCEVGITIGNSNFKGKGYGKEALILIRDFLALEFGMKLVYAHIMHNNNAAIRLFETCDFKKTGTYPSKIFNAGQYHDVLIYAYHK